jgi:nucleotide-binding universal stress UspA family protein
MEQIFNKILVPTDFSPDAERAVRVGSELSRRYVAPLTIIHIYDPVAYPLPDGYMLFTPAQLSRMWAEFEKRLALAASYFRVDGFCRARHAHPRLVPHLHARNVGFVDIRQHPESRDVGDRVELHGGIDVHTCDRLLCHDNAGARRPQGERALRLTRLLEPVDVGQWYIPKRQAPWCC